MNFVVQEDTPYVVDKAIVLDVIRQNRHIASYESVALDEVSANMPNTIPIGTLEFVSRHLKLNYGIEKLNPLEVPKIIRTEEFLKREYKVVTYDELPKTGAYFVKDVTEIKKFSFIGEAATWNCERTFQEGIDFFGNTLKLNKSHKFIYSEIVNLLSEYRVYIFDGKVAAVSFYDGNPSIFPDMKLINKANLIYSQASDYPKSYTMDVMVTDRGTAIVECHILFGTGLYSTVFNSDLLYAYRDALLYTVKYNKEVS